MILGDAQLVVVAGHKGIHGSHGPHAEHLDVRVFVVGHGDQGHADGGALPSPAAVAGELHAVALQLLAHLGLGVHAGDAPFQIGRSRAIHAFNGHRLLNTQSSDRVEKGLGVDVEAIPWFLTEEDQQPAADLIERVLARHGGVGEALLEGCRRAESVVSPGHLEGVAHLVDVLGHLADLPPAVFLDEISRQATGDPPAIGPLAPPASDQIVGLGFVGEGEKFLWHNGPPPRRDAALGFWLIYHIPRRPPAQG